MLSDAAIQLLSSLEESNEYVKITGENLDRSLYLEVASILEACGAKWDRRRKVHVKSPDLWDGDLLDDIIKSKEPPPKNPLAFFPTPRDLAEDMAEHLAPASFGRYEGGQTRASKILEPSAGSGRLIEALIDRLTEYDADPWCEITAIEVDERRARILRRRFASCPGRITVRVIRQDFLAFAKDAKRRGEFFDGFIANPPFSIKGDPSAWRTHLWAMLSLLRKGGYFAVVIPAYVKKSTGHDLPLLSLISDHSYAENGKGAFKESGTGVNTATIFGDDYGGDRPKWDGESLWIDNTYESIERIKCGLQEHGRKRCAALDEILIDSLADAALHGELVDFSSEGIDAFLRHMIETWT